MNAPETTAGKLRRYGQHYATTSVAQIMARAADELDQRDALIKELERHQLPAVLRHKPVLAVATGLVWLAVLALLAFLLT